MTDRQLIARIMAIEREQKRRYDGDSLARYNTGDRVHEKQMAFHRCEKRNRWVFGGNRSGKTECGAAETVWYARGNHPYRPNRPDSAGWVVSVSYEVQRDVAQAKILRYLRPDWIRDIVMLSGKKDSPEYGVIDYILVNNVTGGVSRIGFKSCDQGREKFQGASLDYVWFDEEPPKDIYDECRMRVLDRQGDIWGTMTPLKGLSWVYDEIYCNLADDPQVWCEHIEWADNPYLDPQEIKTLSAGLDEQTLDSRRYGRFRESQGAVYPEFDPDKHVIEPFDVPPQWQDTLAIDPGLHNPLACLFLCVDYDGIVYVVGEWYRAGLDIDAHAEHIRELADRLGWRRDAKGRLRAIIDSAANQRTLASSKSVAQLFGERGIAVNPRVNKELFAGIACVKSYLAQDRIRIFRNCVNLIRELKGYRWSDGDAPVKRDDHALDALRYYLMSHPDPPRQTPAEQGAIAKDKARLIRSRRNRYARH
mgnify:FL=1